MTDRLTCARKDAKKQGKPTPVRLPFNEALFPNAPASVRVIDRDLVAARLAAKVKDKEAQKHDDRGRVLDIHSLRLTFASMLSASGVSLIDAQHLMRHSDPKLTSVDLYGRSLA